MSADEKEINLTQEELEEEYSWWRDILVRANGSVSIDHVLQELHDYRFLMHQASEVYAHVTCGQLSKPGYHAQDVIQVANECDETYIREAIQEVLDRLTDGETLDDLKREFSD